jgi:hypothetical protein
VTSVHRRFRGELPDAFATATVISMLSFLVIGIVQNDLVDRYPYVPIGLLLAVAALNGWRPHDTVHLATAENYGVPPRTAGLPALSRG